MWHLDQTSTGASGEFIDSTSNGNDGRGGGGTDVGYDSRRIPHVTDGQIGNGQHLKGPTTTGRGEGTDGSGNSFKVALPLTLKVFWKRTTGV